MALDDFHRKYDVLNRWSVELRDLLGTVSSSRYSPGIGRRTKNPPWDALGRQIDDQLTSQLPPAISVTVTFIISITSTGHNGRNAHLEIESQTTSLHTDMNKLCLNTHTEMSDCPSDMGKSKCVRFVDQVSGRRASGIPAFDRSPNCTPAESFVEALMDAPQFASEFFYAAEANTIDVYIRVVAEKVRGLDLI